MLRVSQSSSGTSHLAAPNSPAFWESAPRGCHLRWVLVSLTLRCPRTGMASSGMGAGGGPTARKEHELKGFAFSSALLERPSLRPPPHPGRASSQPSPATRLGASETTCAICHPGLVLRTWPLRIWNATSGRLSYLGSSQRFPH